MRCLKKVNNASFVVCYTTEHDCKEFVIQQHILVNKMEAFFIKQTLV